MKSISEHSAGGAVFRLLAISHKPLALSWLLCKHSGYHKWVLPKGIIEPGETPEQAAIREVAEETGVTATTIQKIVPIVRYTYQKQEFLVNKTVEFFLMKYQTGNIENYSWEMEDVRWTTDAEAQNLLSFEGEKTVLEIAVKLAAKATKIR